MIEQRFLTRVAMVFALFLAAGCTFAPPQNEFAEITFNHRSKFAFDIASIEAQTSFRSPQQPPHVEHLMPISFADSAERWAKDRLSAAGSEGQLYYTVEEASVVEEALEVKEGIKGALTVDQSERYRAKVKVKIEVVKRGVVAAMLSAEAERSITVPEDISLKEREKIWYGLMENTLRDLDGELQGRIESDLANLIL